MSKTTSNIMRTRRSRFFWILLCILGEQTPQSGIVAVAPRSLALLEIEIPDQNIVWLQYPTNDSCLGMTGNRLYECGDATLYHMRSVVGNKNDARKRFELRVVDHSMEEGEDSRMSRRERRIRRRTEECLSVDSSNNDDELTVGPCHPSWWKNLVSRRPKVEKTIWELTADGQLADASTGRCIGVKDEQSQQTRMMPCGDDASIVWTFLKAQPQENMGSSSGSTTVQPKKPPNKRQSVEPAMFPELKVESTLLFPRRKPKEQPSQQRPSLPLRLLTNASPMLVAHNKSSIATKIVPPTKKMGSKIQRIQTHPYLNAAKHGVWTDPSTSLDFRTDLQSYLNYDNGRHTLTGVGMYRKYVIKVYGVAFYVSKNSLLLDENLQQYSGLSADELRHRKDFYELLRSEMLNVDRTLLIQTNMQLSAETMRNSLQADWSYLTADAKKLLAETGMRKLPADEKMIQTITDATMNPSRCSCMQTAAPEFRANEECCARGTELAFTWTQGNALEVRVGTERWGDCLTNVQVRLNGRLMATFDRPDIAQGIFYEYLRTDDPISPELLTNVVDGFPFLLAPLNMGIPIPSKNSEQHHNHWWLDHAKNQAVDWAVSARKNVLDAAIRTARGIGEAASNGMEALDRKHILQHIVAAPGTIGKIIQRDEETLKAIGKWMSGEKPVVEPRVQEDDASRIPIRPHHGMDHLRYYYAGDEIGPLKFHPTINRLALILVHFYLLLLFIVSFPGSSYRIIIRKSREPEPYERRLYLWKDRKGLSYNFV